MAQLSLLTEYEKEKIDPLLLDVISYRKSGLSLNHIIGCSLDCAYCVRHFFGNFEMRAPRLICNDDEAVQRLVSHKFFIRNTTPIQLFNRATDPFLPGVKSHTHAILQMLDEMGLQNLVLVITRARVTEEDMAMLEKLKNIKLTLLLTYSGIADERIEPIAKTGTTVESIKTISKFKRRTKLVLYWRPIVMGWNDSPDCFQRVFDIGNLTDAIVYTGYYHRPENFDFLQKAGVPLEYGDFARRKFLPKELEAHILRSYSQSGLTVPLFKKTSCGVTYAHNLPDYNGHWGVNEICDTCPISQRDLCKKEYKAPSRSSFQSLLNEYGYVTPFLEEDGHIWTEGLGEEKRYHLQHTLGYQIWDIEKPHYINQHGRSPFGQNVSEKDVDWYDKIKKHFYNQIIQNDDEN